MGSRTWLNLGLLILASALAIVAVYLPGVKKPAPLPALTSLTPETIISIRIERKNQPAIALKKDISGWRLTEPLPLSANTMTVESLLGLTQAVSHARWPATNLDLEKFKLKSPRMRVRLNNVELGFGDTEALEGRRYVLAGTTVHLITDSYYPRLIAPPVSFVSLALLPDQTRLEQIELPGLRLTRGATGWSAQPSASPDAVNILVQEWTAAQALQVSLYTAPAAQINPVETITLRQQDAPTPLRFVIVSRTPELILARPELGVQYHFPQHAAQRLLTLPAAGPTDKLSP